MDTSLTAPLPWNSSPSFSLTILFVAVFFFTASLFKGVLALTRLTKRAQNVIIGYRTYSEVSIFPPLSISTAAK